MSLRRVCGRHTTRPTREPEGRPRAARRILAGAGLLVLALGCAKKGPPSGGPPDIEAPRLIVSVPDSGSARVARQPLLSLTFSEGMEPRATSDAIALSPPVEVRRFRWSGRTVSLVLADSLAAAKAYTLFVGRGARDRHGNAMEAGATVVFTTGDSFPAGAIEGRLEARGFTAPGCYLWCYDADGGRQPDSTGGDFDAVGLVDVEGRFRVPALAVPGRYRLWTFADVNRNRLFEPDQDLLVPVDTVFRLTPAEPVARGLVIRVTDPHAPARVKGAVLDSLGDHEGALWVMAVADSDSTRLVLTSVSDPLQWELQLAPGAWTLRAFRDLDRNRLWSRQREPASDPQPVRTEPAGVIEGIVLEMRPVRRGP